MACRKAGIAPGRECDLSSVRVFCTAGSPLRPRVTGTCTNSFRMCCWSTAPGAPTCARASCPARCAAGVRGEISGRCLGVDAHAFDADGREVVGELGELVICRPMPSMPVGLWGDPDGSRYRHAYFDRYPGVWRRVTGCGSSERGSCVITGRSDATLNRGGVRLGTGEFYAVVEELPEGQRCPHRPSGGCGGRTGRADPVRGHARRARLDAALRARISERLRSELSPRHLPDAIVAVPAVPRTLTGKSSRGRSSGSCAARRSNGWPGRPQLAGQPGGARHVRGARPITIRAGARRSP